MDMILKKLRWISFFCSLTILVTGLVSFFPKFIFLLQVDEEPPIFAILGSQTFDENRTILNIRPENKAAHKREVLKIKIGNSKIPQLGKINKKSIVLEWIFDIKNQDIKLFKEGNNLLYFGFSEKNKWDRHSIIIKKLDVIFSSKDLWSTKNLNIPINDSECYDIASTNCEKYGQLYSFEEAKKACQSLDGGWRLPSREDWEALISTQDYKKLRTGDMKILIGGKKESEQFNFLESHGYYWTTTEYGARKATAVIFNESGGKSITFLEEEKYNKFSCRCIKN